MRQNFVPRDGHPLSGGYQVGIALPAGLSMRTWRLPSRTMTLLCNAPSMTIPDAGSVRTVDRNQKYGISIAKFDTIAFSTDTRYVG